MSEQALSNQHVARAAQRTDTEVKYEADPGPWLFFAAPLSFVLTLATLAWLSLNAF